MISFARDISIDFYDPVSEIFYTAVFVLIASQPFSYASSVSDYSIK